MSDWNEELPKYKAKKKGIVDQRPVGNHKRQKRGWLVKSRKSAKNGGFFFDLAGMTWYRGITLEACKVWIEKERRHLWLPFRGVPDELIEDNRKRNENRCNRFYIISPVGVIYERDGTTGEYRATANRENN